MTRLRSYDLMDRLLDPSSSLGLPLCSLKNEKLIREHQDREEKLHVEQCKSEADGKSEEEKTQPPASDVPDTTESEHSEVTVPASLTSSSPMSDRYWSRTTAASTVSWLPPFPGMHEQHVLPQSILGDWTDSMGNSVAAGCMDSFGLNIVAKLSKPPRHDLYLKVRQSTWDGHWYCGGAVLQSVGGGQVTWMFPDGSLSIWTRHASSIGHADATAGEDSDAEGSEEPAASESEAGQEDSKFALEEQENEKDGDEQDDDEEGSESDEECR